MSAEEAPAEATAAGDGAAAADSGELRARVEVLREENRRLRNEYSRARRAQYRKTAVGLAAVGVVAVVGGIVVPAGRTVLFALGGTGLFAALLTYYLTPERFIPATVGADVYGSYARVGAALEAELGLQAVRVYVPTGDGSDDVRLFVPQHADYELPSTDELTSVFVVPDDHGQRGVAVPPTGLPLFREFSRSLTGPVSADPAVLGPQLADGLVEAFEIVESATPTVNTDEGHLGVGITGSAYDTVDRFDHPVPSFLAVGLAVGLERPVTVETVPADDDRTEYVVHCRWETASGPGE